MTDRLERLERHLSEVLAGPRRLMRSLGKHTTGKDMNTKNDAASILAEMREWGNGEGCFNDSPEGEPLPCVFYTKQAWDALCEKLESALTKAAAVAWREFSAWVRAMPTSAGMEHWVCVGYGNTHAEHLTTNVFKTRGRAEYEVAEWNHLFGRCDKPDILAFDTDGPPAVPGESLAAYCTRSLPGKLDDTTYQQIENALDLAAAPMRSASGEWLTLAERVAAIKPAEPPASVPDGYPLSVSEARALIDQHEWGIAEAESIGADYSGNERKLELLRAIATNQEGAAP